MRKIPAENAGGIQFTDSTKASMNVLLNSHQMIFLSDTVIVIGTEQAKEAKTDEKCGAGQLTEKKSRFSDKMSERAAAAKEKNAVTAAIRRLEDMESLHCLRPRLTPMRKLSRLTAIPISRHIVSGIKSPLYIHIHDIRHR